MKERIKKYSRVLVLALFFFGISSNVYGEEQEPTMMDLITRAGYEVNEADRPESIVLIDGNTGKYLWGENPDLPWNPASIMKLMTLYLVYEAMAEGAFDLNTEVIGTDRYQAISQIYALSNSPIQTGVAYPVNDLIPMVLVPSSNVATLMLAELVEPNPAIFLEKMNEKAQALGMTQTTIYNATGAQISAFEELYVPAEMDGSALSPWEDNSTTARDLSVLVYHILHNYPEILGYTNTLQYTAMVGTPYEATFDSYNHSLPGATYALEGTDGLKTGSSGSGGFNIAMTGQRDDLRLITIVLGVGNWENQDGEYLRHPFANAAFEYGFDQFEYRALLGVGEQEINSEQLVVEAELYDTVRKEGALDFEVVNGKIGVSHPLPTISESISQQSVAVTPVESPKKVVQNVTDKVEAALSNRFDLGKMLRLGILVGVGLLALLIAILVIASIRTKQKRRRARQRRGRR